MDGATQTVWQSPTSSAQLDQISKALDATLNPRIPNDIRQQALTFLEQVKTQPDGPSNGFLLAEDWKQPEAVRYYGLQLLEHAVRYRWAEYDQSQTEQLRTWVKCLAGSMRETDASFLRNKIAQIWVEIAKRCWGEEWMNMDQLLLTLWEKPVEEKGMANKILVLYILELLSEDICNREDANAGLRLDILGSALNDIMIPALLYKDHMDERGTAQGVRAADEGWLTRICGFFSVCVKQSRMGGSQDVVQTMAMCAIKALNALRPTMAWISFKAVQEVNFIDCLFLPFHTEDDLVQTATVEVIFALLSRPYNGHFHDTWLELVHQALQPERLAMIERTYRRAQSGPGEDDEKLTLQKKLSEVLSILADALAQHPELAGMKLDVNAFFSLLVNVLQSQSLVISIPVLHSWTKLLAVQDNTIIDLVMQALATLLQVCSTRLINYEALPSDSNDLVLQFLYEDFDTMPERHAFLGNYRRYCVLVIETISRQRPREALSHVLEQTRSMIDNGPYTSGRGFDAAKYTKKSLDLLQFDAQFNVVLSVIKGVQRWEADVVAIGQDDPLRRSADEDRAAVQTVLQQWSYGVMNLQIDDPEVASQLMTLLSSILRANHPQTEFVLHVVQHMLTMRLQDNAAHATFSEAVKNFEALRVIELQKVALSFPNQLIEVYPDLENRVGILIEQYSNDARLIWGYKAFLFMIVHRASGINPDMRLAQLRQMMSPVYEAWQDHNMAASVSNFDRFCETLGLSDLPDFYRTGGFAQVQDWSSQQTDEAGQARQENIKNRVDRLPLRMTKSLLAATTEKLKEGTEEHDAALELWGPAVPLILPSLLKMIEYAQAFNNLANWSQLPEELQVVIRRTLQDRFWQSGISHESRDEFYARISGSKTSYEGFASTVRGTVRNVREQGYHTLYLLTKFDEQFYGLSDLAEPLARSLFADAEWLSANHLHPIINLATGIVQRCPPHHRGKFLPPLLTGLFAKLDRKISGEWETILAANQNTNENDDLSEEMRMESVLRQLTFSMVSFVAFLLEHDRPSHQTNGHVQSPKPTIFEVVLSDISVLEPLFLFCTHALRMRDTRCCVMICKLFTSIIPLFASDDEPGPQVRDFICTEVLKACITSLNEPYFAEMQRDLAALIAQIILLFATKSSTPRDLLLSLPDMSVTKVDRSIGKICNTPSARQQRALVLDLLEGVRGVSIHEAGRISKGMPAKKNKTSLQQQYMEVEQRPAIVDGDEVGLEGVADLFGGA